MGKGIPGGFAGDLGGPSRGEDDPARRARRVSETGRGSRVSAGSRQRALMCGPGAQRAKRARVRGGLRARGGLVGPREGGRWLTVRAVSGCDAGLLGARGADRWGRQLRRVARAERARLWSGRAGLAAQEGVGR